MSEWVDSGRLVTREISDLDSRFDVKLFWKPDVSLSPAGEEMVSIMRSVAAKLDHGT